MYINVYKASAYSYTDRNFKTLEEAEAYLKIDKCPNFTTNSSGLLVAKVNDWKISIMEGDMPNEGEGFVNMVYESGALDYIY